MLEFTSLVCSVALCTRNRHMPAAHPGLLRAVSLQRLQGDTVFKVKIETDKRSSECVWI